MTTYFTEENKQMTPPVIGKTTSSTSLSSETISYVYRETPFVPESTSQEVPQEIEKKIYKKVFETKSI